MGSLNRSSYFLFLVFSLQDLSAETTYRPIRWQAYDFHMLLAQPFIKSQARKPPNLFVGSVNLHFLVIIPQILDFERERAIGWVGND
jgi:hypothetical protein